MTNNKRQWADAVCDIAEKERLRSQSRHWLHGSSGRVGLCVATAAGQIATAAGQIATARCRSPPIGHRACGQREEGKEGERERTKG